MPEGHTLHRLARELDTRFSGQPVLVTSPQGRFAGPAATVDGRRVDRVTAYGKHLLAHFDQDRTVHVHLGLFGRVAIGDGTPPLPVGAIRMRWVNGTSWADLRGPNDCEILDPAQVDALLGRLGPDPLATRPDGTRAYARIARSRAPIAGLLMDQQTVAGIGNVYRAELLFRHRVDPYLPGRDLGNERWLAMWSDLVTLMRAGLRSGRIITTRPVDRDRPSGRVRQEDAHYVYRRTGLPCRICGSLIAMQLLAARKLYWCPTCQYSGRLAT